MIRGILILFLLQLTSCICDGQQTSRDYSWKAVDALLEQKYDSVIYWDSCVTVLFPKSEEYPTACAELGQLYFNAGRYEEAAKLARYLLGADFYGNEYHMTDAHLRSLRHNASSILEEIYREKALYDSAYHYLIMSDSTYGRNEFQCGNEAEMYSVDMALEYATLYECRGHTAKAEERLLSNCFGGLFEPDEVIERLKELFKEHENAAQLKKDIDSAVENYIVEKYSSDNYTFFTYYMVFKNVKIRILYIDRDKPFGEKSSAREEEAPREKFITFLKKSSLYRMVQSL